MRSSENRTLFFGRTEYANRIDEAIDDIDEAVVSRCIALLKFNPPDADARRPVSGR